LTAASLIQSYISVAAAAVLLFDYLLTLNQEIKLIWKRPFSAITILFFITRYSPFIDTTAVLVHYLGNLKSEHLCVAMYHIQAAFYLIGVCASEGILVARTAAVWGNSKRVFWGLTTLLVLIAGAAIYLEEKYISVSSIVGTSISVDGVTVNLVCPLIVKSSAPYLAGPWILVLAFETILICLIVPKAISQRVFGRTNIYDAIYVNGVRFYLYTFVISLANIIILFYPFSTGIHPLYLMSFDRILHAILAERLILSIRGAAAATTFIGRPGVSAINFYVPGTSNER